MNKTKNPSTHFGLLIAFLGVTFVVYLYALVAPDPYTDSFVIQKETIIFAVMALLVVIILKGEKMGLDSIGLHRKHGIKSLGTALGLAIVLFAALLICVWILGIFGIEVGGEEGKKYESISLWTMALVTIRAGIVEEVCYRGYIMERLEKMSGGNTWIFLVLPVVIFAWAPFSKGMLGF